MVDGSTTRRSYCTPKRVFLPCALPCVRPLRPRSDFPPAVDQTVGEIRQLPPRWLVYLWVWSSFQRPPDRYKLVTRDMGPYTRCVGTDVPPPQDFQLPLPDTPTDLPSYTEAKRAIGLILEADSTYASLFVTLAYQCASTFRSTDYMGGCNGARIRFPPQSEWASNAGLSTVSLSHWARP